MLAAGFLFLNPSHAKVDSRVIVTSNSTLHDGDTFAVKLTDLNNTPIANQAVNVTIIDANGGKNPQIINTDANGYGSLQLNGLTPGEYTFNITYGGNENYTDCNFTQKITIEKPVTSSNSNAVSSSQPSDWVDSNGYLISMKTERNMLVQEMGSIWILQPVIMLENMEWLDIFFKLIIATDYLLLFLSF